jgi:hypothetical protein
LVVPLGHQLLHRDGGFNGPYDAWKLQQQPIAGVFHNATAVIEDERECRTSMSLERGMRTGLVGSHHSRIAGDVGANNGGQVSLHLLIQAPDPAGTKVRGRLAEAND